MVGAAASPLAMCHSLTMRSSRTQKTSSLRHRHHRRHHRLQHHRHHHRHRPALSTAINALPASPAASASCPSIRTSAQHTRQRPSFSEDATIIYALISCVRVTASARQTRSSTRARAVGMCTGASLVHRIIHGGGTRRVFMIDFCIVISTTRDTTTTSSTRLVTYSHALSRTLSTHLNRLVRSHSPFLSLLRHSFRSRNLHHQILLLTPWGRRQP